MPAARPALGFDTFLDLSDSLLFGSSASSNFFKGMLYTASMDYLNSVDRGQETAEGLIRVVTVQDVSEAIVESSVSVAYSFGGGPQTFGWKGFRSEEHTTEL